ncbi:MAG: LicD family protein [Clostridia bacterium]|nr:LicD family protein [Clostridia bacterium]
MSRVVDSEEYKVLAKDVLTYVDEICRKNGIVYYMAYGTLLGAVRHQGFIPWDDDVDIIMDRDNFERFITCSRKADHPFYKLMWLTEQSDFDLPLPKVVDTRTELKQAGRRSDLCLGAWVDILIIDDVPDDPAKQKKALKEFDLYEKFWSWSQYSALTVKSASSVRSFVVSVICRIMSLPGSRFWSKKLYKWSARYNGKGYGSFSALTFSAGKRRAYRKEWLGNGSELLFEGKLYMAPENWDAYLTNTYGDYMQLPPKDKQVSNHNFTVYYKD